MRSRFWAFILSAASEREEICLVIFALPSVFRVISKIWDARRRRSLARGVGTCLALIVSVSSAELDRSVQVLQSRIRRREDLDSAPEGEALQVSHMSQEAVHRSGPRHSLHAGAILSFFANIAEFYPEK